MIIGACTVDLFIRDALTLKDKRRVIKSLITRLSSKYNVSIAETGSNESIKHSVISFAVVSNTKKHADSILEKILYFIENVPELTITDTEKELW